MVDTVTSAAKAAVGNMLPNSSKAQNRISSCLRHRDFVLVMIPPFFILPENGYLGGASPPFIELPLLMAVMRPGE